MMYLPLGVASIVAFGIMYYFIEVLHLRGVIAGLAASIGAIPIYELLNFLLRKYRGHHR